MTLLIYENVEEDILIYVNPKLYTIITKYKIFFGFNAFLKHKLMSSGTIGSS